MEPDDRAHPPVHAGDLDGLRRIYSGTGGLITESGEKILLATTGWDAEVSSLGAVFSPGLSSPGSEARPQANSSSQQRDLSWCATSILGESSKENSPHWVFQLRPRR